MADEQNSLISDNQVGQASIQDNPNQSVVYSNMCGVMFGPEEVMLQFAIRDTSDLSNGFAVSRVYSNFSNIKRLILILNKSLKDHEELFGEIPVDPMQKLTPLGLRLVQEKNEQ